MVKMLRVFRDWWRGTGHRRYTISQQLFFETAEARSFKLLSAENFKQSSPNLVASLPLCKTNIILTNVLCKTTIVLGGNFWVQAAGCNWKIRSDLCVCVFMCVSIFLRWGHVGTRFVGRQEYWRRPHRGDVSWSEYFLFWSTAEWSWDRIGDRSYWLNFLRELKEERFNFGVDNVQAMPGFIGMDVRLQKLIYS